MATEPTSVEPHSSRIASWIGNVDIAGEFFCLPANSVAHFLSLCCAERRDNRLGARVCAPACVFCGCVAARIGGARACVCACICFNHDARSCFVALYFRPARHNHHAIKFDVDIRVHGHSHTHTQAHTHTHIHGHACTHDHTHAYIHARCRLF